MMSGLFCIRRDSEWLLLLVGTVDLCIFIPRLLPIIYLIVQPMSMACFSGEIYNLERNDRAFCNKLGGKVLDGFSENR